MSPPLRIGLTARLMYPDPQRAILSGKNVHYSEENAANWLIELGAVVFIIPRIATNRDGAATYRDYAHALDGLVLQGGSDVAPASYGERALRPEWAGDPDRDAYELELFREFRRERKPILGICRGCQLINVAMGGSLFQDLETQCAGSGHHCHPTNYDVNFHEAVIEPKSRLATLYGSGARVTFNSIHHQAIDRLGQGLVVEARSHPDGIVEAVRGTGGDYLAGVQWHPEFRADKSTGLIEREPLANEFLEACALRRTVGTRDRHGEIAGKT
jgi:putative glutamine amidotransferase